MINYVSDDMPYYILDSMLYRASYCFSEVVLVKFVNLCRAAAPTLRCSGIARSAKPQYVPWYLWWFQYRVPEKTSKYRNVICEHPLNKFPEVKIP
jgi:hypothetical protein